MIRKCFEFLGLVESKQKKPIWISQVGCGTLDDTLVLSLLSKKLRKKKRMMF